jgi:hypothetical protein
LACEKERTPEGDDVDALDEAAAGVTSPAMTMKTMRAIRVPNRLAEFAFVRNVMNCDMYAPLVELEVESPCPAWPRTGDDRLRLTQI